jgi:hypothetical protein
MNFSATGNGIQVAFEMELNPRGLMRLLSPMIERQVRKANTVHLDKFKEILEGR